MKPPQKGLETAASSAVSRSTFKQSREGGQKTEKRKGGGGGGERGKGKKKSLFINSHILRSWWWWWRPNARACVPAYPHTPHLFPICISRTLSLSLFVSLCDYVRYGYGSRCYCCWVTINFILILRSRRDWWGRAVGVGFRLGEGLKRAAGRLQQIRPLPTQSMMQVLNFD